MSFQLIYDVDFKNGNLMPGTDTYNWGGMAFSPSPPGVLFDHTYSDNEGIILKLTRPKTSPANSIVRGSVFVQPQTFHLATRLRLQIEFDRPTSEVYFKATSDETLVPSPPGGTPDTGLTRTETWVIAVALSANDSLMYNDFLSGVTCQFNRALVAGGGVRVNTPFPLQQDPVHGSPDRGSFLDVPLNYERYNDPNNPNNPTIFKLDHFFCGYPGVMNCQAQYELLKHTVGCGRLEISDNQGAREDYRLYSSMQFYRVPGGSPIFTLGTIITSDNVDCRGRMGVRIRRFRVWENVSVPFPPTS